MGGFEVILVLIGLSWTIASAVMQKKAKAAKAARLEELAKESSSTSSSISTAPMAPRAKPTTLQDRLGKLREQILDSVEGTRGSSPKAAAAPMAATPVQVIKVPQPQRSTAEDMLMSRQSAAEERPSASSPVERPLGGLNAHELSRLLSDPQRIKEAMVLKEILGPPLALRS